MTSHLEQMILKQQHDCLSFKACSGA